MGRPCARERERERWGDRARERERYHDEGEDGCVCGSMEAGRASEGHIYSAKSVAQCARSFGRGVDGAFVVLRLARRRQQRAERRRRRSRGRRPGGQPTQGLHPHPLQAASTADHVAEVGEGPCERARARQGRRRACLAWGKFESRHVAHIGIIGGVDGVACPEDWCALPSHVRGRFGLADTCAGGAECRTPALLVPPTDWTGDLGVDCLAHSISTPVSPPFARIRALRAHVGSRHRAATAPESDSDRRDPPTDVECAFLGPPALTMARADRAASAEIFRSRKKEAFTRRETSA